MLRFLLSLTGFFASSTAALAHAGHVGELAGHAHWIGLGATVAAAAILAALAKAKKSDTDQSEDEQPVADDAEGEAA